MQSVMAGMSKSSRVFRACTTITAVGARRWHGLAASGREVFAEGSDHDDFPPPSTSPSCTAPSYTNVDNVSTPAIASAHAARTTNLASRPLPHSLAPRQQQLQTSTQRPTTRKAHTLQPAITPCSSTSPQQTTRLLSPSKRQRKGTAKDEAIPAYDATRRNLFPLVPHQSHDSCVDHYGMHLPLLLLSIYHQLTWYLSVHPHLPRLLHLAKQLFGKHSLPRSTTTQQHVLLSSHRFPLSLRSSLQSAFSIHLHPNSRVSQEQSR